MIELIEEEDLLEGASIKVIGVGGGGGNAVEYHDRIRSNWC